MRKIAGQKEPGSALILVQLGIERRISCLRVQCFIRATARTTIRFLRLWVSSPANLLYLGYLLRALQVCKSTNPAHCQHPTNNTAHCLAPPTANTQPDGHAHSTGRAPGWSAAPLGPGGGTWRRERAAPGTRDTKSRGDAGREPRGSPPPVQSFNFCSCPSSRCCSCPAPPCPLNTLTLASVPSAPAGLPTAPASPPAPAAAPNSPLQPAGPAPQRPSAPAPAPAPAPAAAPASALRSSPPAQHPSSRSSFCSALHPANLARLLQRQLLLQLQLLLPEPRL